MLNIIPSMTFHRLTRASCAAVLFVLAACKPGTKASSTSPPADDPVVGSVCARDQDCNRGAGPNPPLRCLFAEGCGGTPTGRCGEAMGECVVARPFCDCAGKTRWGCTPTGRYRFSGTCEDGGGI